MFKKSKFIRTVTLVLILVLSMGTLSACGSKGDTIKVGSKEFTENIVLGKIAVLALEDAGFKVEDKTGVAGSDKVRAALENGDFDLYWEYTGTAWLSMLQNDEPITDSQEAYEKVKEADEKNGFIWLQYAPLNNTYTLMMRQKDSEELGIKTISDLAKYINENPGKLTTAIGHEFAIRPDGYPGIQSHYGYAQDTDEIKIMDMGIMYKTLRDGQVDVAMGLSTDGRIAAFNLVTLEDDKSFLPVYNAAPVVRKDALEKNPEIKEVLEKITPFLDSETITKLNYEVDIDEREPGEVAEEWMKSEGLID